MMMVPLVDCRLSSRFFFWFLHIFWYIEVALSAKMETQRIFVELHHQMISSHLCNLRPIFPDPESSPASSSPGSVRAMADFPMVQLCHQEPLGLFLTQGFAFQQPLYHQEQVGGSFWRVAVKDVGRYWMTSNRSHVCWGIDKPCQEHEGSKV